MAADDLTELLNTLQTSLESVVSSLPSESQLAPPDHGISLLDTKNELFLSYLHNLVFLILFKIRQVKEGPENFDSESNDKLWDDTVKNLVRLRLYSEKGVRPIENRLRYEIDRVIQAAEDASNAENQQMNGNGENKKKKKKKAKSSKHDEEADGTDASASGNDGRDDEEGSNPSGSGSDSENEGSSISGSEEEDEEEELAASEMPSARANLANFRLPGNKPTSGSAAAAAAAASSSSTTPNGDLSSTTGDSGSGVYRPPRIAPTAMPANATTASERRRAAKGRGGAVRSEALNEYIAEEMSGAPSAMPSVGSNIERAGRSTQTNAQRRAADERRAYEEANFVRLPAQSKKERKQQQQRGEAGGSGSGAMKNGFGGEDWRDLGAGAERVMRELEQRKKGQSVLERSRKRGRDAPEEIPAAGRGGGGGAGRSSFEKKRKLLQKRSKRW